MAYAGGLSDESQLYLCPFCDREVTDQDCHALSCAKKGAEAKHWSHLPCLENNQLLSGNIKVTLTENLMNYVDTLEIDYTCPACDPDSMPLPFQLVEQGLLAYSDFEEYGLVTPQLARYFQQKGISLLKHTEPTPQFTSKRVPSTSQSLVAEVVVDQEGRRRGDPIVSTPGPPSQVGALAETGVVMDQFLGSMKAIIEQTSLQMAAMRDQQKFLMDRLAFEAEERKLQDARFEARRLEDKKQHDDLVKLFIEKRDEHHRADTSGSALQGGGGDRRAPTAEGFAQLPKMEVAVFNGDVLEWPAFWDAFDQRIHSQNRFSAVEKMNFLLNHLGDSVKPIVQNIRLEAQNYPEIIKILNDKYNNKLALRTANMQALAAIPPVKSMSVKNLQEFSYKVEAHARALAHLDDGDAEKLDLRCAEVTATLFAKLPLGMRTQMYDVARDESVKCVFSAFRKALQDRMKVQETIQESDFSVVVGTSTIKRGSVDSGRVSNRHRFTPSAGICLTASEKKVNGPSAYVDKRDKRFPSAPYCHFCQQKGSHRSFECPTYNTFQTRVQRLGKDRCFICFRVGHTKKFCRTKGQFKCLNCGSIEHNSALCYKLFQKENFKRTQKRPEIGAEAFELELERNNSTTPGELAHLATGSEEKGGDLSDRVVVMPTAVTFVRNPVTWEKVKVSVLLDSGSSRTYISQRVAKKLDLKARKKICRKISSFSSKNTSDLLVGVSEFEILGKNKQFIELIGNILESDVSATTELGEVSLSKADQQKLKGLQLADPAWFSSRSFSVDVLLGSDFLPMFWEKGKVRLQNSGVFLHNSALGWVASGLVSSTENKIIPHFLEMNFFVNEAKKKIEEESSFRMENLWDFESIGIRPPEGTTIEDQWAYKKFKETAKMEGGRVSVQWIKRDCIGDLPSNYSLAYHRFRGTLANLKKKPQVFVEKYQENFQKQFEAGVIEKVTPEMPKLYPTHYLPHHPVVTPGKTTKLRVVYDASARANKMAKSLNDCLFRGPNLLEDVCGLLFRFRTHPIAITADLEKAFLQLNLQISERDLTRFFWLKDPSNLTTNKNLQIYRFARVPFGLKTSPFLLAAAIRFLLERVPENLKDTAARVKFDLYVDNLVTGVEKLEQAKKLQVEARKIFDLASMNLREWDTNSKELRNFIPEGERGLKEKPSVGLIWDTGIDTLTVVCPEREKFRGASTKRQVVSCLAAFFDPLGLFSCLKTQGMIFVQDLWRRKLNWDDELPGDLKIGWEEIQTYIFQIPDFSVPRVYGEITSSTVFDLLCFVDASVSNYAALVFLRGETEGQSFCSLVFAKSRLVPMKKLTVPRAELMAVLIGTRSLRFVEKHLHLQLRVVALWSDSQIVIDWLKTEGISQETFVSNRVREILNYSKLQVGHVPSDENPADLATKLRVADYQVNWPLWWHGPPWVLEESQNWRPFQELHIEQKLCGEGEILLEATEKHQVAISVARLEKIFDLGPFTFFPKLVRVTALVRRVVQLFREKMRKNEKILTKSERRGKIKPISSEEYSEAQWLWVKATQAEHFPKLVSGELSKSPLAQSLRVFLDDQGILRCRGRLEKAELEKPTREPILMPKRGKLIELIIGSAHKILLHAGIAHTLVKLREEFWIPQGRATVGKILNKCNWCKRWKAKSYAPPKMSSLPRERVTGAPPFKYTGVDYFGPMLVKAGKGESRKAWGILFTCFVVRAVHLELVADMSGENFSYALRRFVAVRRKPAIIYSDNGSQFVMIKKFLNQVENTKLTENFGPAPIPEFDPEIKWRFIPELSPFAGGVWERCVGLVKSVLRKVLGKTALTFEQLRTVLAEVETVVNSRPLTHVDSKDSDTDFICITPLHFLSYGGHSKFPLLAEEDPYDPTFVAKLATRTTLLKKWQLMEHYLNSFWNCWYKRYLVDLRARHATDHFPKLKGQIRQTPKIGEVVLIKAVNTPRALWRLGRVQELHEGPDGLVRSVSVKTPGVKNWITRPVGLLCPLELSED